VSEDFDTFETLIEGNPDLVCAINLIKKAVEVIDEFCEVNGKKRLPAEVTVQKQEAFLGFYCEGEYEEDDVLTVCIDETANDYYPEEILPDDANPYTTLLHEYGHWIHARWLKHAEIPEGERLLSQCDGIDAIIGKKDHSDNDERFAETFAVFANNPLDLAVSNPTRFAWMTERLKVPQKNYPKGKLIDVSMSYRPEIEKFLQIPYDERKVIIAKCKEHGLDCKDTNVVLMAFANSIELPENDKN